MTETATAEAFQTMLRERRATVLPGWRGWVRCNLFCRVFRHEWWTWVPFDLSTIYCPNCLRVPSDLP